MKRLLFLLADCLMVLGAMAQTVPYRQLNTSDFRADLYPAVRVQTNRFPTFASFNTNYFIASGGQISLSTSIVVFAESIWTNNLGITTLKPTLGSSVDIGLGLDWWVPDTRDGFIAAHDSNQGEPDTTFIAAIALDNKTSPTNFAYARFRSMSGASASANLSMTAITNGVTSGFDVGIDPISGQFRIIRTQSGATDFYVADTTGYTGTGTNALSDDGTFKPFALQGATTNLFQTIIVTNLFATTITNVSNLYVTNLFATNTYTTNLYVTIITNVDQIYVTNLYSTTTYVSNIFVTNITANKITVTTNITINNTNVPTINPTDNYIPVRTGTNSLGDSPLLVSGTLTETAGNIGALLSVGDSAFVDVRKASQTNQVAGAVTIGTATNGVDGVDLTHVRWFFNSSGSDQTLTIPSGWRTNAFSAVPAKLTNAWITVMYVKCGGPTATAAQQTNCYVSFEYYH